MTGRYTAMYSITQDGAAGMENGTREHHSIQRRSVDDQEVELDEVSKASISCQCDVWL